MIHKFPPNRPILSNLEIFNIIRISWWSSWKYMRTYSKNLSKKHKISNYKKMKQERGIQQYLKGREYAKE